MSDLVDKVLVEVCEETEKYHVHFLIQSASSFLVCY